MGSDGLVRFSGDSLDDIRRGRGWSLRHRSGSAGTMSAAPLALSASSVGVVGDEPARRTRGGVECLVPRREENVVPFERKGACEVDGVMAAQDVLRGEIAGVAGQWFVDRYCAQLRVESLDRGDRAAVCRSTDVAPASRRGERCAGLEVDQLA